MKKKHFRQTHRHCVVVVIIVVVVVEQWGEDLPPFSDGDNPTISSTISSDSSVQVNEMIDEVIIGPF